MRQWTNRREGIAHSLDKPLRAHTQCYATYVDVRQTIIACLSVGVNAVDIGIDLYNARAWALTYDSGVALRNLEWNGVWEHAIAVYFKRTGRYGDGASRVQRILNGCR